MNRRREITGLLLIVLGILIFLSLVSYNPNEEPTISSALSIDNWMGLFGVYIAFLFIKLGIGYSAFVIPVLLILWGVWIFGNKNYPALLRFTVYILLTSIVVSISLAVPDLMHNLNFEAGYSYSGLIGGELAQLLYDWLHLPGTIILLAVALIILVTGYFRWSFYSPLIKMKNKVLKRKTAKSSSKSTRPKTRKTTTTKSRTTSSTSSSRKSSSSSSSKSKSSSGSTKSPRRSYKNYKFPPTTLLKDYSDQDSGRPSKKKIRQNSKKLESSLETFNVHGKVVNVVTGPIISRYEVEPESGVRVKRISNLASDLARILKAESIRIIAPIPGKSVVGIEIPNNQREIIYFQRIVQSKEFQNNQSHLAIALGTDTTGKVKTINLARMPHLLIAGATGSGKSVCINMMIASILYQSRPNEVKFVMIDPKRLELSLYEKLSEHYLVNIADLDEDVITQTDNAIVALRSLEMEMERRYDLLSEASVRNIDQYNQRVNSGKIDNEYLPKIVIIIDELADLMMTSAKEIEGPIARLAQMARAVGIHMIIATQRPSVDVITGVIKANFPARIAFKVTSKVDSRTILDNNGAENLLGRGDMLITTPSNPELRRYHSAYISLEELEDILDHIQNQPVPESEELPSAMEQETKDIDAATDRDELFNEALKLVVTHQQGSASMLQRRLKIGYARASRIIDQLENEGIVGPHVGSKAREVLVDDSYLYSSDDVAKGIDDDED
ncbi:MAG: DNA translocase FtsK [Candidatus Marinimicrobia bacterium]|nr:DNA translocase FtsK [Candidatus Neomarinimicrobiota bacterium]